MRKTKIAIACQGGGSQTAFTAGALAALTKQQNNAEFEVVSISGTSGGAVCAALIWFSFQKGETPLAGRLLDFWKENTAHGWLEEALNASMIRTMRMVNRGMLPSYAVSPSSPAFQRMAAFAAIGTRPNYSDFSALLRKHIDFDEIAAWGAKPGRALIIGAANVTSGKLAKFVSTQEPIKLEHILASCAVPNIFPAVEINGDAYWDGLFSDNPPVEELIRPRSVGFDNVPDEIWLIKINPTARKKVPVAPADIADRRNQLEGNISLFQQLRHLELLNDLILADAFRPEFLAQFELNSVVRIPKSFDGDAERPYHIPCIEMPEAMQEMLDYEGKIDRSAKNIDWLIAQGEACAASFLEHRAAVVASRPIPKPDKTSLRRPRA